MADKIIDFPDYESAAIEIRNTEEFMQKAYAVDDYLNTLPCTQEQFDRLTVLLVEHLNQAKRDAFMQGFEMGVCIGKDLA